MKYGWEADALEALYDLINDINNNPKHNDRRFCIVGIAVENESNGEGAYLSMVANDGSLALSDVMQDVTADAQNFYNATVEHRRKQSQ
jgi:hypothetical protein